MTCAIKWCGKNSKTSSMQNDGITFHRFPTCPERKKIWIDATRRGDDWWPTKNSVICSRHFTQESFFPMKNRRRLMDTSVPTEYLPILMPSIKEQKNSEIKSEIPESDMEMIPSSPKSTNSIQPSSHNNITPMTVQTTTAKRKIIPRPDSPSAYKSLTSKRLCRRIIELKNEVLRKNKTIKSLRDSNRRLKNKITSLNALVGEKEGKKSLCVCVLTKPPK